MGRPASDSIGERFGRLVVIEIISKRGAARVRCACDCGASHEVQLHDIRTGYTRSCGCARAELFRPSVTTHGMSYSPEYLAWQSMNRRCADPRVKHYDRYGGRGITVCDEWKTSFEAFFAHVGPRPSAKHSLDREDNDSGYRPGNVRWATKREQSGNRRTNVRIVVDGSSVCQAEAARFAGVSASAIRARRKSGVVGDALLAPPTPSKPHACGVCGVRGHNRRTCPLRLSAPRPTSE